MNSQHNKNTSPPAWADRLLEYFCAPHLLEEVQGDLHELYGKWVEKYGERKANRLYVYHTIKFFRPFALKRKRQTYHLNTTDMLKSYFKIALRNFRKQKVYSIINVSGLAIGMACCILLFIYVQHELSFDKHHQHFDHIYRLIEGSEKTGEKGAILPGALLPYIKNEIPEIQEAIRIHKRGESIVSYQDEQYIEKDFLFADPAILHIFTLPLVQGDKNSLFTDPSSVLITERTAKKYFGEEDPIGKTIEFDNAHTFTVAGILKDIPGISHFQVGFLAPISRTMDINKSILETWDVEGTYIYLLIHENANISALEQKALEIYLKHNPNLDEATRTMLENFKLKFYLEPLKDVHLYSADTQWDFLAKKGDITYVAGATLIAILLLIIAGFNFMNLTTAHASHRAKEIGIKKVLGVSRKQLVFQFYTETFFYTLSALFIAILLAELFLPFFNQLTGQELEINLFSNPLLWMGIVLLSFIVFLLAGSYPAFYLSGLQPAKNLRDLSTAKNIIISDGRVKIRFRHLFVIAQFVISITLIISSFLIARQIEMMTEINLGFDKEHVLIIDNPWDKEMINRYEHFTQVISNSTNISKVGSANMVPAGVISDHTYIRIMGTSDEENIHTGKISVNPQFFETIGTKMVAGRNFSENDAQETSNTIILNETAVKKLQLQDPVGASIQVASMDEPQQVIGVVKDMQYESLHVLTKAVVYFVRSPANTASIFVKVKSGDLPATLVYLEEQWEKIDEKWPFRYQFMDDRLQQMYQAELRAQKIINTFTVLTIFISCLGLFGLASFTAAQRTKEVGIRKVLGASVRQIVLLLSQDFSKWILIAFIIACPIAYWVMDQWLQNFTYKIEINGWVFALAGILVITIAWLTISYQSIKAALANPVDSLRNE